MDSSQEKRIAGNKQFKDLLAVKRMFIIPALSFFLLDFVGFVVLVGYDPKLASLRVIGTVNVAYLFALLQFVLGWTIAGLYLMASEKFDRLTKDILFQTNSAKIDAPRGAGE
jgi:uncharacterized membrane protein (DUF485 family)